MSWERRCMLYSLSWPYVKHHSPRLSMNFADRCESLLQAITHDDLERTLQLLDSGISLNTVLHSKVRREHATVLGSAAYDGRCRIVRYLIENGGHRGGRAGNKARKIIVNFQDPCLGRNALHWAVMGGHPDITSLLLDHGADVNSKDRDSITPLIHAVFKGSPETIQILIDQGADVNHHDRLQATALHHATDIGHRDIVTLLIKAGCIQNNLNAVGRTPFVNLFYAGDFTNCRLLLEAGYNLHREYAATGMNFLAVPNVHLDFVQYLHHVIQNPQSLCNICRKKIRASFKLRVQDKIKRLPLPLKIIRFLLLEDVQNVEIEM